MLDLKSLEIPTARALICVCEAEQPMSVEKIKVAVALRNEKRYDDETLRSSLSQLQAHDLVDEEFFPTQKGFSVYRKMKNNKTGWAEKFFCVSNSPNVGPRAPSTLAVPPVPKQHVFPAIPGLNPNTW
jgi:hypothetical protein